MSFSADIKREVISAIHSNICCRRAALLAFLTAKGVSSASKDILLDVEGEAELALAFSLINECYHKTAQIEARPRTRSGYTLLFSSTSASEYLRALEERGEIDMTAMCSCKNCRQSFLMGLFIACAKVSSPEKCFFLEFTPRQERIRMIQDFLERLEVSLLVSSRREKQYLYTKNGAYIADFFALIGNNQTTFAVLNKKIERQLRSESNRLRNCETGNIQKSIDSSAKQIEAIRKLIATDKLSVLPDELKAVAILRVDNPDLSLSQLSYITVPQISKSGLNHRLKKIMEIADRVLSDTSDGE